MDVKLGDDIGKKSSTNVDISDLDVSFPVKKCGKPTGTSKDISAEKKTQGKSDQSILQFHIDGFDDSSFESSLGQIAKEINANQDAEPSPSLSGSLGFGTRIGASEGDPTLKFDSQIDGEPNSLCKEKSYTSLTDVHLSSKSEIPIDQATNLGATTSPQKPISQSISETDQGNCQKERTTHQEQYKDICHNSSLHSVSENSSTQQTARNSTEEVGSFARKNSTNTDCERSISGEKTDFSFSSRNIHLDKLLVDIEFSQSNDGEHSQFSGDNPVCAHNNDNAEPTQSGTQFEQTSMTTASKKILHEIETDGETINVTSELGVTPSNTMKTIIETTGDKELPGSRRSNIIRSKYIKGSDEAKSQLQQSSVSGLKATSYSSKRIKTFQSSPADEGSTMGDKTMQIMESLPIIRSESFEELYEPRSQLQQASSSQVNAGTISSKKVTTLQQSTATEKGVPLRMDLLSASEKFLELTATVAEYGKSDKEKEQKSDEEERESPEKDLECFRERVRSGFKEREFGIYDVDPNFLLRPFREAVETNTPESLKKIVAVCDDILVFKMMFRAPCRLIEAEVQKFKSWCAKNDCHPIPPSSIYEHAVVLDHFGLDRMIGQLVEQYLKPIINVYFGFVGEVDHHFSFWVEFGANGHNHIDLNYNDDSDITVKLCVSGADSRGADLLFSEPRCSSHETVIEPPPKTIILDMGQAVMHCGRHRNGVLPIEYLSKQYIVIWMKSSVLAEMNASKSEHPEWCIICRKLKEG